MKKFNDYLLEYTEAKRPDFLPPKGMVMEVPSWGGGSSINANLKTPDGKRLIGRTKANYSDPVSKTGQLTSYAKILKAIKESKGGISPRDLINNKPGKTKLSPMAFHMYTKELVHLGILKKEGSGKNVKYLPGENFDEYEKYAKQHAAEKIAKEINKKSGVIAKPKKFQ